MSEQDQESRNQRVISEFRANAGRVGGFYAQMSLLLLGTTGRRSGRRHTTPLSYLADGDRYVVVAAAGGAAADPDWYRNLVTRPQVTVEAGNEEFEATALVLTGAERAELFQRFAAAQPVLTRYQDMTARSIPVITLTQSGTRKTRGPDSTEAVQAVPASDSGKVRKGTWTAPRPSAARR